LLVLLLAKERVMLVLVSLIVVTLKLGVSLPFHYDRGVLLAFLCGAAALATPLTSRRAREWKPSYVREKGTRVVDLIVLVLGLLGAGALLLWMRPR
jgi:hypothetical protein